MQTHKHTYTQIQLVKCRLLSAVLPTLFLFSFFSLFLSSSPFPCNVSVSLHLGWPSCGSFFLSCSLSLSAFFLKYLLHFLPAIKDHWSSSSEKYTGDTAQNIFYKLLACWQTGIWKCYTRQHSEWIWKPMPQSSGR